MIGVLADVVQKLNLQPGEMFREEVNGHMAELKLIDSTTSVELDHEEMLRSWFDAPFESRAVIRPNRITRLLPDPVVIDESDLAPE